MTGIILAGGNAVRMGGADKAFLKIHGHFIITRQLRIMGKIFKRIIIVNNAKSAGYEDLKGVALVSDVLSGRGPLGGIYSGLLSSRSFYNFIAACDMPFLNESAIRYMIKNKNGYDIVVPKIDGRCHPLFAVYSKTCIPVIEKMLKRSELKILNLFDKVKTLFISRTEMGKFDKRLSYLTNINTKDDLDITTAVLH